MTDQIQDLLIQALNVSVMFAMGLDLTMESYTRALSRRRVVIRGLLLNFVVVPALGIGLATGFSLESAVGAGLVLSAIAPGGGTGTLLTQHARGDLALSVALLTLMAPLSLVGTSLLAAWALPDAGSLNAWAVARTMAIYQLFPLMAGMALRAARPQEALRLFPWATKLGTALLVVVVVGLLVAKGHLVLSVGVGGLVASGLTVVVSLALGFALPGDVPTRSALGLTTAVRNLSLALLLSTTFFPDPRTTMTILAYGLLMYLLSAPVVLWLRSSHESPERSGGQL